MPEQIGKLFVTKVTFQWCEATTDYRNNKSVPIPGHWDISATLSDKPSRYRENQTMLISVEHGIGQKLAEALLPAVIADASRKAQQLADDSKAMLTALEDRTLKCLADMPEEKE